MIEVKQENNEKQGMYTRSVEYFKPHINNKLQRYIIYNMIYS